MPISLSGSLNLSGSLTTTGTITATTLVVQTITSSISSITGSTNFGSLVTDTHKFTGSMAVTGGLVDINKDGQSLRIFPQLSSGSARIQLQNSGSGGLAGANAIIAVENSTGADLFSGTSPFSLVIGTATQKAFHLGANSAIVMTITGSNVGIGTSSPSGKLHLSSTGDTYFVMTGGGTPLTYSLLVDSTNLRLFSGVGATTLLTIASTGAATFTGNVSITKASALLLLGNSTTNSYGALQFLGNASGQGNTLGQFDFFNKISGTDVLSGQIEIAHDSSSANNKSYMALRVHNGTSLLTPLYISSDGVLDLAIGQIKFPATQNASSNANTLDDYEEGTFTPNVGGNATYSKQEGNYTKIGNMVYVRGELIITGIGTGSPEQILGLPFTSNKEHSFSISKLVNSPLSFYSIYLRTAGASIYASYQSALDGTLVVNPNYLTTSTEIQFSGCYTVA
jgi:hypothetical protein